MSDHKKESTDNGKSYFNTAVGVAEKEMEIIKEKASQIVEEEIVEAKRLAKKGRRAAEDLMDETAQYIKHDPFQSVAITFAVGLGLGIVMGWLIKTETKQRISKMEKHHD